MTITNRLGLPAGLVKAVTTERHNRPGCLSATTLLQGTKQIILTERHWEELEDDVSDRIWAIFGTAVHSLLEHEGENEFTEQEMSCEIGGVTVTGRIDNYNMATGVISDFKSASVNKVRFNDFSDWRLQGLIYAWLLSRSKFPVTSCRFIALLKDHSKTEAERDSNYPRLPTFVYEFPVTPTEIFKTGNFLRGKVTEYAKFSALPDDEIPACSQEQRWERPSSFAVKKEGRQKAVRVFDDRESAAAKLQELGEGHFIEERKGASIKCEHYCLCRAFCNFCHENAVQPEAPVNPVSQEGQKERLAA